MDQSTPTIVIAGGGVAGLSLALALKDALGSALRVALCDPASGKDPRADSRAFAIAAGPRRMLEALGVWSTVADRAQPMLDMVVTDSRLADPVRPVFLSFAGEVEPGEPFAHMVENGGLVAALEGRARELGVEIRPVAVARTEAAPTAIQVETSTGESLGAALLVAADGARSRLREAVGIGWVGWSYPQAGLVATVTHERGHEGRAVEHFLPSGPFAILPLAPGGRLGHRSSIVWTERQENVPALLALSAEEAVLEVERRFGRQLGLIDLETPLRAHPLAFGIARRFVAERLALIGDAAHVIHPIAGQGLNLGLKDVAALAEAVVEAARLGLDPGGPDVLKDYERARRFDTLAMGAMTDGLNRLFSNDALPVRLARDLGLGIVDRIPMAKRFFIREAAGLAGAGPRLLRGQPL
jgi:2-octaprenyl-6-methoxyphenol hydroxylase